MRTFVQDRHASGLAVLPSPRSPAILLELVRSSRHSENPVYPAPFLAQDWLSNQISRISRAEHV